MNGDLTLTNRQRFKKLDIVFLRKVLVELLDTILELPSYDLSIILVSSLEMARLNQEALGHEGSTDVITFDYSESLPAKLLAGELFICVEEAAEQARSFRTDWCTEVILYCVHGILHLQGYDDLKPDLRKTMKRVENRLVSRLSSEFPLRKLQRKTKVSG